MNNNNYQNIIKRIDDIRKELGISGDHDVSTPGSIKDIAEQILDKITSNSNSTINGKIIDIYNKMNNVYYDLSSTSTSYTKGKVNELYNKFNNIYNELNSTSTSYMKGKVNIIYDNIVNNQSGGIDSSKIKTITKYSKLKFKCFNNYNICNIKYIVKPEPLTINLNNILGRDRVAIVDARIFLTPGTYKYEENFTVTTTYLHTFYLGAYITTGTYSGVYLESGEKARYEYLPKRVYTEERYNIPLASNRYNTSYNSNNYEFISLSVYDIRHNNTYYFVPYIHDIQESGSGELKFEFTIETGITTIVSYYTI